MVSTSKSVRQEIQPLIWPGLSEREIEEITESAKKPSFETDNCNCLKSWIEDDGEKAGAPAHLREAVFKVSRNRFRVQLCLSDPLRFKTAPSCTLC